MAIEIVSLPVFPLEMVIFNSHVSLPRRAPISNPKLHPKIDDIATNRTNNLCPVCIGLARLSQKICTINMDDVPCAEPQDFMARERCFPHLSSGDWRIQSAIVDD